MNVIVSNKNQLLLENLGVDIIKEMNGEFEVDEIIATFQNFFYQRMILDITAIKNYTDIVNLQKLSISLDMISFNEFGVFSFNKMFNISVDDISLISYLK